VNPVIGGSALVIFVGTTGLKSGEMLMKRRREEEKKRRREEEKKRRREDGGKAGKKWVGY
jgi:hypothetical protein